MGAINWVFFAGAVGVLVADIWLIVSRRLEARWERRSGQGAHR